MLQDAERIVKHTNDVGMTTQYAIDPLVENSRTIHHLPSSSLLLRPLLHISKSELLIYATENSISYREDSTNISLDYQRNYLRHEVLPKFETINPVYRQALGNFIEYTEETKYWIDDEIRIFLAGKTSF